MKFSRAYKILLFLLCLISFSVTSCVKVIVNTDGGTLPGVSPGCETDPNTGQLICANSCEQTYEHTVTVAKHQNLDMLDSDVVNDILEKGQQAAQEDEGFLSSESVECQLSLKLAPGGLNVITDPGGDGEADGDGIMDLTQDADGDGIIDQGQDDTVDTEKEYISLMQRPEWVKAVKSLYVCGLPGQGIVIREYPSNFSGCATDYPFKLSIVEYDELQSITYHGSLWLHEMGHTRGNTHTPWEQGDSWVMYGAPSENSNKLSCRECARFLLP